MRPSVVSALVWVPWGSGKGGGPDIPKECCLRAETADRPWVKTDPSGLEAWGGGARHEVLCQTLLWPLSVSESVGPPAGRPRARRV